MALLLQRSVKASFKRQTVTLEMALKEPGKQVSGLNIQPAHDASDPKTWHDTWRQTQFWFQLIRVLELVPRNIRRCPQRGTVSYPVRNSAIYCSDTCRATANR